MCLWLWLFGCGVGFDVAFDCLGLRGYCSGWVLFVTMGGGWFDSFVIDGVV